MPATYSAIPYTDASTRVTVSSTERGPKVIYGAQLLATPAIPNDANVGQVQVRFNVSQPTSTFAGSVVEITAKLNIGSEPIRTLNLGTLVASTSGSNKAFSFYLNQSESIALARDQGGFIEISATLATGSTGGVEVSGYVPAFTILAEVQWTPAIEPPPTGGGDTGSGTLPPGATTGWFGTDYIYSAQFLLESDAGGGLLSTWSGSGDAPRNCYMSQQGVGGDRSKYLGAFSLSNWAVIPDGATVTKIDVQVHGQNLSPNDIQVGVYWTNSGHFNGNLQDSKQVGGGGGILPPVSGPQILSFSIGEAPLAAAGVTRDTLRAVSQGSGFILSLVAAVASGNQAPSGNQLTVTQIRTQVQYRTATGGVGSVPGPLLFISE
jgi:hypothetical protein